MHFQSKFSKFHLVLYQFNSSHPAFGKAIAFLRKWWGNIAVRWYVEDLITQQMVINQTLLNQLQEVQQQLAVHKTMLTHLTDSLVNDRTEQINER